MLSEPLLWAGSKEPTLLPMLLLSFLFSPSNLMQVPPVGRIQLECMKLERNSGKSSFQTATLAAWGVFRIYFIACTSIFNPFKIFILSYFVPPCLSHNVSILILKHFKFYENSSSSRNMSVISETFTEVTYWCLNRNILVCLIATYLAFANPQVVNFSMKILNAPLYYFSYLNSMFPCQNRNHFIIMPEHFPSFVYLNLVFVFVFWFSQSWILF